MNDIYGKSLLAYLSGNKKAFLTVESNIAETEEWPIELFFREYEQMPESEKIALNRTSGKILDAGAGAGSHALYLQEKKKDIWAIDISKGAVEVMKKRGIKHAFEQDFFTYEGERFDTLLLLMNGIGLVGKLENLSLFFEQAKKLLNANGKILLDSSDIIYLFEEEDGSVWIDLNASYYGEINYQYTFENEKGDLFDWLFIDFETLADCAKLHGFTCEKIYEDEHYLYLAELKRIV